MSNLLTPEADSVWMDQIFGLNYLTVSVLIGLLLIGILARFATMLMAPRVLKKIIPSDSIQSKTVKDSDKALGTAAGAGITLVCTLNALMSSSMSKKTTVSFSRVYCKICYPICSNSSSLYRWSFGLSVWWPSSKMLSNCLTKTANLTVPKRRSSPR